MKLRDFSFKDLISFFLRAVKDGFASLFQHVSC